MAVTMRPAKPADIEALLQLEGLFPSDRMDRRTLRRFIGNANAFFCVAEVDGGVRGNLLLLTRRGSRNARIYSLVVDPQARALGIGRRLVECAESEARQRGLDCMALEVRADNLPARGLYERLGYIVSRPLPGFYDDGADGVRMIKRLSGGQD